MRRLFVIVILFSMGLHCSSRVGLLSYLYQQRHEMAYAIGLITEIPIAICSSDYDFSPGLTIHQDGDHESAPLVAQAREITLFFYKQQMVINFEPTLLKPLHCLPYQETPYNSPALGIFQPPRI